MPADAPDAADAPDPHDPSPAVPGGAYLEPYRQAVADLGAGFAATLWGSEETQRLRFDILDSMLPLHGRRIVDLGCGQGDLLVHLRRVGVEPADYLGLDAMEPMIRHARERQLPGARFAVADLVRDAAVVRAAGAEVACISGTLNTMSLEQARRLVAVAFEASSVGVVFNFLSDRHHPRWADRNLTPARRFDAVDWLDWSLGHSSRVRFDQSYLDGHDATIAIMHDG